MLNRPEAIGLNISLESIEDVDAALHEMGWLAAKQSQIEGDGQAKIEAIKNEAQARMVVEVEGQRLTFKERFDALWGAVHGWCESQLKGVLPLNKRSAKLSHGELKLRALPAAVALIDGKKPADVARGLAREAGILSEIDRLLSETEIDGVRLSKLLSVEFVLAKDAIKAEAEKTPDFADFLRARSITIETGSEQITIVPALVQVTTQVV